MTELDAVRDSYLTLRDCFTVTSELVGKSTKRAFFHRTTFLGLPPEGAKRRLTLAKADLDDWAIVAFVSVFERILNVHPESPLRSKAGGEGTKSLDAAGVCRSRSSYQRLADFLIQVGLGGK
ncbi:MAG: hypothetical protein AB1555_02575 [Nitrospirota bacterium]